MNEGGGEGKYQGKIFQHSGGKEYVIEKERECVC